MSEAKPFLAHDTIRVLYANEVACALFCCEPLVLTTRLIADLIVGEDFGTLARIHMQILREKGESPAIEYPFLRCNMTVFWAMTESYQYDDKVYAMILKKTYEEW